MDFDDLYSAVNNLRKRESRGKEVNTPISWVRARGDEPKDAIERIVWRWLQSLPSGSVDSAIWTGLKSNLTGDVKKLKEDALRHIGELQNASDKDRRKAFDDTKEYVCKSPVDTEVREYLLESMSWKPEELSNELFEPNAPG
jgi:hypothetical protein